MEGLRECPFCGNEGKFNDLGSGRYHIHCKKCAGQWGSVWGAEESAEETVLGWNTRATDPLFEEMARALKGVLNIISDSSGVSGYHLNGDVAEWDEFDEINQIQQALQKWEATC